MRRIHIGHSVTNGKSRYIPSRVFPTHFHLIGATGKGKTTAIKTLLVPLLEDIEDASCFLIIDPLGSFSDDLLLWMASQRYCPQHVRDRLLYVEPSTTEYVLPFNPLTYDSEENLGYRVDQAKEAVLRGWSSQSIEEMPRLARWLGFCFTAAAEMDLTIADCYHLLYHGSDFHDILVERLPERLRLQYRQIRKESTTTDTLLDSTRNRLNNYFEMHVLRRMFGSRRRNFDAEQFIRDKRIVLVNLAPQNRISRQLGSTIGGLMINEFITTARNLRGRFPVFMVLDEFQNFVGRDIADGLPELRQLNVRMILSHQSFFQLEKGETDLRDMIFQAQSRMVFGVSGSDADILASELSDYDYDPKRTKHILTTKSQRNAGWQKEVLRGGGRSTSSSTTTGESDGRKDSEKSGRTYDVDGIRQTFNTGTDAGRTTSRSSQASRSESESESWNETLLPILQDSEDVSGITYYTPDEQERLWRRYIKTRSSGQCVMKLDNDPNLYKVQVKQTLPHLTTEAVEQNCPELLEAKESLLERNFHSDVFVPKAAIEVEITERMQQLTQLRDGGSSQRGPRDSFTGGNE